MTEPASKATPPEPPPQVIATPAALELIKRLQEKYGPVMFHQSGGCCDGSSPMCYPQGEFLVGDNDVLLGEIGGAPFYISKPQFEYWKHTQLIIDVVPGRAACSPWKMAKECASSCVLGFLLMKNMPPCRRPARCEPRCYATNLLRPDPLDPGLNFL